MSKPTVTKNVVFSNPSLDHGVTYRAPSGRLCTLSSICTGHAHSGKALLVYSKPDGTPGPAHSLDCFVLSTANWYLLKEVR